MIRVKAYGWILFLIFFCLQTQAQTIDFSGLEKAIDSGNRKETALQFHQVSGLFTDQPLNMPDFHHLLRKAHELSRSGMADLVWPDLFPLAVQTAHAKNLTDTIRLNLLSELGAALYYDNQFGQADSVFRSTLPFFTGDNDTLHPGYAFTCNFLGLTGMRLGQTDSAFLWLEKAKTVRIHLFGENHPQVGAIYNNLGLLLKNRGNFTGAVQNYQKAIDIKRKANDPTVYLNLLNLGELYGIRGQYAMALSFYRQADSILCLEKPTLKQADLYLNSGAMMYYLEGYQEALDFFLKALRIYESLAGENSISAGKVYQNLANVYSALGDRPEELKAIEKALSILERGPGAEHADLAPLYNNLGMIFQNSKEFGTSLLYLKKAKELYLSQQADQPEKISNTLLNTAMTYQLAGQKDSAVAFYRQAIAILENHTGGYHPYLSFAFNSLARIYLRSGYHHIADSLTDRAIAANFPSGKKGQNEACFDPGLLLESWMLKGTISWKSDPESGNRADNAFFFYRKADTLLSFQRNFLFHANDKIIFSKYTRTLAESSLECLVNSRAAGGSEALLADGFRFAEKSRNLVLLQTLQEKEARHLSGIPDSLLAREEELRGNISALNHQIETNKGKLDTEKLEDQLFTERRNYRLLVESMEREYPAYRQLKFSDHVPSVSGLQKNIGEGMALLAYFTGDSAVYRFMLTDNHFSLDRSGSRELEDLITGFRKGITLRLDEVFREKAGELYRLLIPHELSDNVDKLVIVPDAGLSAIPFEALLSDKPQNKDKFSDWPFLVSKYVISYAPSLAIWNKGCESLASSAFPASFLGFAPVFDEKWGNGSEVTNQAAASKVKTGWWLEALPSTRPEILGIDALFKSKGFHSEYHLSGDATENSFHTARLQDYGYLHMATHGFVNEKHPGLSGLYFYPQEDSAFDNVLYLGEIYHLKLNARLVTLSACETGLGKLAAGEGILGFSRAFLLAGARNLLLSLWKVNDASTTQLMTQFYKFHLENEIPLAESLRKAKLSLISNPETSHPYFWAGFVLTGN